VPLRDPLVPQQPAGPLPAGRDGGAPYTRVRPVRPSAPPLELDPDAPTLVLAGDGAAGGPLPDGAVLVAEPSSGRWAGSLRSGAWLLGAATTGARPDLLPRQVVVLGRPTLHRAVQRLLGDDRVRVHAVPGHGRTWWNDTAFDVVDVGSLPPGTWGDRGFAERWRDADAAASAALDAGLDADPVGGMRLARDVVAALPARAQLVLGPSSPIRDVALCAVPRDVRVLSNRGVAGIDGVVSTAVGAALAHDGPTVALLGDVTLLHDATGLLCGAGERRPDLTLVVANDDGGSVFTLLEQGAPEHADTFERVFGTPHGADLESLCRAYRVPHVRLDDAAGIADAITEPGLRVVEVPVDRAHRRDGHAALRTRIETALAPADAGTRLAG
jgi:2-succinyl-5-enolpyruvyl-6-hydroxy-3-cyclohexene-1-carboxylate synthase